MEWNAWSEIQCWNESLEWKHEWTPMHGIPAASQAFKNSISNWNLILKWMAQRKAANWIEWVEMNEKQFGLYGCRLSFHYTQFNKLSIAGGAKWIKKTCGAKEMINGWNESAWSDWKFLI